MGPKLLYLSFWAGMLRNYCHICNQRSPVYLPAKFCAEVRILKFGIKKCLVWVFWPAILKNCLSYLKSTPSNLSYCKVWCKKMKILIFVTKNVRYSYFGSRIWKYYCHIWNPHPQICLIAKFCEIIKMPKLGTKNVWFGYFWVEFSKKYSHI